MLKTIFDSIVYPDDRSPRKGLFGLFVAATCFGIAIFGIALWLAKFGLSEKAGPIGDFVGGILNPLLTFLTFLGLLITIVLQQQELAETRKELMRSADAMEGQQKILDAQLAATAQQNFEASFFQMLNLQHNIVNSIDVLHGSGRKTEGRDCFKFFSEQLRSNYHKIKNADELKRCQDAEKLIWEDYQQNLGHYYRYLYNIIKFLEESGLSPERYVRIMRSQISNFELIILYYNGLSSRGGEFKKYAERYALFNNLPKKLLLNEAHRDFYAPSAFNTELADEQ